MKQISKKIVLLGEPAVGKTSLIRRFVLNSFDDKYVATIGVKVSKKSVEIESDNSKVILNMMIYDVLGQHDFKRIREKYVEGANGAILVGDLSNLETIEAIENYWIPELERILGTIPLVILGNKLDLTDEENEAFSLIRIISNIISCPFQLCSAKMGYGVEEGFSLMAEQVAEVHFSTFALEKSHEPIKNYRMAADAIMDHFCESHENKDEAIKISTTIFEEAGVSSSNPRRESLLTAIEILAEVERELVSEQSIARNKLERLSFIREAENQY